MTLVDPPDLRLDFGRIEAQLEELGRLADPSAQAIARDIVQTLLIYHGAVVAKMVDQIALAGEPGRAILDACADDALIRGLLLLHGLHPVNIETRIRKALDAIRPSLQSRGEDVEIVAMDGDTVRLRLREPGGGSPSTTSTLRSTIEDLLLEAAPDLAAIELVGTPPRTPSGWVPLSALTASIGPPR